MKKLLYTFIALTVFNLNLKADGFRSKLHIRTFNNQSFIIEIDRIKYNNPTREFNINELTPGDHKIKIWTIERCGQHFQGAYNNFDLVFNGFINIPARSKVKTVLTYQNILKVTDIEPLQMNYHQECNNMVVPGGYGYCGNYNGNYNGNYYTSNYYNNNYQQNQFEELKDLVARESFDDTRLAICKEYIRTHQINSNQTKQLIGLMTFESNRVELAKFSYRYVSDPDYFYTVYQAFTFDSSVNELIYWINHQS